MSRAPFELALLNGAHDRATFNSGSAPLDRYLREQVTQDVRRRVAACFVATTDGKRMAGYYTLASASLLLAELPASTGKKLPRYPTVPAVRMGRLAVSPASSLPLRPPVSSGGAQPLSHAAVACRMVF